MKGVRFLRLLFCFRRAQGGPGGKEHKGGTRTHSGIAARADSGRESRLHDRELQVRRDRKAFGVMSEARGEGVTALGAGQRTGALLPGRRSTLPAWKSEKLEHEAAARPER